jgi:hypothetical protein
MAIFARFDPNAPPVAEEIYPVEPFRTRRAHEPAGQLIRIHGPHDVAARAFIQLELDQPLLFGSL